MAQLAGIEDIYERNSTTLGGAYFTDKDLEIIGGAIDLNNFITQNGWPNLQVCSINRTPIKLYARNYLKLMWR